MKLFLLRLWASLGDGTHRMRQSKRLRVAGETKHWYFITQYYCPVCNGSEESRERVYGPRPYLYTDRHEFQEGYDGCEGY